MDKEYFISELTNVLVECRIDSLWKMISLKTKNLFPSIYDEGASGDFDNKGAIFVPGGLISSKKKKILFKDEKEFHDLIIKAMKFDNATLIYHDGIVMGQRLDSSFFSKLATNFMDDEKIKQESKHVYSRDPPDRFTELDISISYCPKYMVDPSNEFPSFGSRTTLSASIATCFTQTKRYYYFKDNELKDSTTLPFELREIARKALVNDIYNSRFPVKFNEKIIAGPYIVVSHTTRYKEENYTGLIRILGYAEFGEFATISLESESKDLIEKLKIEPKKEDYFASYKNENILGILRIYPKTTPGKRLEANIRTELLAPKDFNLDIEQLNAQARIKYNI